RVRLRQAPRVPPGQEADPREPMPRCLPSRPLGENLSQDEGDQATLSLEQVGSWAWYAGGQRLFEPRRNAMSLFGKKIEATPAPPPVMPPPLPPVHAPPADAAPQRRGYGVADLIMLMKTIPTDRHPELVVRVVKSTLESVGVRPTDIIEDALRHEGVVRDR